MSTDLQKLFDTDPLSLTKENIDSIITYYRAARANFNLEGKAPAKPKAEKTQVKDINLDELLGGPVSGTKT
jgi:hypothetical protein